MELIKPVHIKSRPKIVHAGAKGCFATTYDMSDSDKGVIHNQIKEMYGRYGIDLLVVMSNLPCNEFLKDFWRTLAF